MSVPSGRTGLVQPFSTLFSLQLSPAHAGQARSFRDRKGLVLLWGQLPASIIDHRHRHYAAEGSFLQPPLWVPARAQRSTKTLSRSRTASQLFEVRRAGALEVELDHRHVRVFLRVVEARERRGLSIGVGLPVSGPDLLCHVVSVSSMLPQLCQHGGSSFI